MVFIWTELTFALWWEKGGTNLRLGPVILYVVNFCSVTGTDRFLITYTDKSVVLIAGHYNMMAFDRQGSIYQLCPFNGNENWKVLTASSHIFKCFIYYLEIHSIPFQMTQLGNKMIKTN